MNVRIQIQRDEGRELRAYPDPLTHGEPYTIGVGHTGPNVHANSEWTDEHIDEVFELDVQNAIRECQVHFPFFASLNEQRQAVLIGMCFQMGIARLLEFKNTLGAVRDERYADAAEGMRRSLWAEQTPGRVRRLAHQMETGEWQ